jgi:hypothetical protein
MIQRVALEFPFYGRPRITAELRRGGWQVNHKRVGPHHAGDNLLCLRRRGLVVTTDSNHNLRVIPIWPRRWKSPVSTSWEAIFSSGRSRFRLKATMDVCISPHGQTLDISRAVIFPGALAPKKSELMMARLTDGVFRMDAASATIMKKINTGAGSFTAYHGGGAEFSQ